ncbi:hypothetical protein U9M48_013540 [Paspalum notatum var. saurae]|uniref:Uncharacterized protein n=1 Tax=Paspalum notatum var. saurae TaxID=547442 RepID=A0AAQ3T0L2_PASNO
MPDTSPRAAKETIENWGARVPDVSVPNRPSPGDWSPTPTRRRLHDKRSGKSPPLPLSLAPVARASNDQVLKPVRV